MKPQYKFKYNKNKYSSGIYKICTGRETVHSKEKPRLKENWDKVYKKFYAPHNQYGVNPDSGLEGVLTSKGTWSAVNQINTHATAQDVLIQYLNQQISNKFVARGIEEVDGRRIKLIEFDPKSEDPEYIRTELDNYFFWINYFGDKIFKNLNEITKEDPLHQILEIANFTMAQGTFGEMATEYLLKTKLKDKYNTYRNSSTRGDFSDMITGTDIYVTLKSNTQEVRNFQVKNSKIYSGNTIYTSINTRDYKKKGVDYLVLAQIDIKDDPSYVPNPTTLVFLPMKEDLLKTNKSFTGTKDTYTFDSKDIIMEENISPIFKSKPFFEFFKYCSKQGIGFDMDVSENETKFEILEKSIKFLLPEKEENFDESVVIEAWRQLIEIYNDGPSKKENLEFLQQFVKK